MVRFDQYDKSLVIEGFENGISDDPYTGIADEKNVNIITIPGEGSVSFATATLTSPTIANATVTTRATNTLTVTGADTLESKMAIFFTALGSLTGISTNTPYWVANVGANQFQLYSDNAQSTLVVLGGTVGSTPTFSTYNVGGTTSQSPIKGPKHFAFDPVRGDYYMLDSIGQVWTNKQTTTSGYWTFAGNKVPGVNYTSGNGIGYYQASGTQAGYIFVFHNSSIDYVTATSALTWVYQWDPSAGTSAGYNASPTALLNAGAAFTGSHETLVGQDNVLYYCDTNFLGSIFEKDGSTFNPASTATYTYAKQALQIPAIDNANCLAELGINLLVGGQRNLIYPWDRTSTSFMYPIFLAESVIAKMQTINTSTFIFVGNRGRIYITNGSQAQLYKKIPDHISGTVEPYYKWGGVCSTKNQLYFSASVTTNTGTAIAAYGGVWAIDMDTKAIRLTNKLSYATYLGYATAMIAQVPALLNPSNPTGFGLYIGWDSGASTYGLDGTTSAPYTGSQASIDSDLIPIGTYDAPRDFTRIEYRLTKPMVSGESVTIKYRLDFSQSYTTVLTDSTVGNFSLSGPVNFKNAQWLQLQAVLNSTASSPSYTRLKEIRIKGISGLK